MYLIVLTSTCYVIKLNIVIINEALQRSRYGEARQRRILASVIHCVSNVCVCNGLIVFLCAD